MMTKNQTKRVQALIRLAKADLYDNAELKRQFYLDCRLILTWLASELGLEKGQYEIRYCKGGVAVSGDIILHSDDIYVSLSQSGLPSGMDFMWRTVKSRNDYRGNANQWSAWAELLDLPALALKMKRHIEHKPSDKPKPNAAVRGVVTDNILLKVMAAEEELGE